MHKVLTVVFCALVSIWMQGQQTNPITLQKQLKEVDDTTKLRLLNELYQYYIVVNYDSALLFSQERKNIAEKLNDSVEIANSIRSIGACYWTKGDTEKAFEYFTLALNKFIESGYEPGIASAYNNLGLVHYDFGNHSNALEYYLKALKIYEQLDNKKNIAALCNNISNVFIILGDYNQALPYLNKSLKINQELDNQINIEINLVNKGSLYMGLKMIDSADFCFNQALEIAIKENDLYGQANCYENIAIVYQEKKEYILALKFFNKSIETYNVYGAFEGNLNNYNNMGVVYDSLQNYRKALEYSLKCFELAQSLKAKQYIQQSAYSLSEIYAKTNDTRMAHKYLKVSYMYRDSLLNEDTRLKVNQLEMQHKFDKKIQEAELKQANEEILHQVELSRQKNIRNYAIGAIIMLLFLLIMVGYSHRLKRKSNKELLLKNAEIGNQSEEINLQNEILIERNEKITEQKEKIEKLNKSKDKIFSIIGHDLRNVVGTTANSLSYLANKKIALDSENTQLLLNELRDNAKRTFNLLENLLLWGKSQMSGIKAEPIQFNLTDSIKETLSFLSTMAQKKNITIHNKFNDKTIVFADPESIKTVIRNLISNAIKFTDKDGEIEIAIVEENGRVRVSVNDNGTGIPNDIVQEIMDPSKFHTTTGTSHEGGAGLGLSLCHDYLVANNSKLEMKSEEGKGSEFYFYLPLNNPV
jgi:signal transduction histidine kinase